MEPKRVIGCVFVETPKECSQITPNGNCLGIGKLQCIFNHFHLIIPDDAKEELIELLRKEMNSERRYKKLSGEIGRVK